MCVKTVEVSIADSDCNRGFNLKICAKAVIKRTMCLGVFPFVMGYKVEKR